MTVLFLWDLQSQGWVGRTLQYKKLCWTTCNQCTSYTNHRKVHLDLGWLWYFIFLTGFSILPPSQPCTGAPTSSPCLPRSCCEGVNMGTDPLRCRHRSTAAHESSGMLRHRLCLHGNSLSRWDQMQCLTYVCRIKPVYGTNREWPTNICWKTPTDQHKLLGPRTDMQSISADFVLQGNPANSEWLKASGVSTVPYKTAPRTITIFSSFVLYT